MKYFHIHPSLPNQTLTHTHKLDHRHSLFCNKKAPPHQLHLLATMLHADHFYFLASNRITLLQLENHALKELTHYPTTGSFAWNGHDELAYLDPNKHVSFTKSKKTIKCPKQALLGYHAGALQLYDDKKINLKRVIYVHHLDGHQMLFERQQFTFHNKAFPLKNEIDAILHVYQHGLGDGNYLMIVVGCSVCLMFIMDTRQMCLAQFHFENEPQQMLRKEQLFFSGKQLITVHGKQVSIYRLNELAFWLSMSQRVESEEGVLIPLQEPAESVYLVCLERVVRKQEKDNERLVNTLSITFSLQRMELLDRSEKVKLLFASQQHDQLPALLDLDANDYLMEALMMTEDECFIEAQLKHLYESKLIGMQQLKLYFKGARWKLLDCYPAQQQPPYDDLFDIIKMFPAFDHAKLLSHFQHHLLQNLPFLYFHHQTSHLPLSQLVQGVQMAGDHFHFLQKCQLRNLTYLNSQVNALLPHKKAFYAHFAHLDRLLFGITPRTEDLLIQGDVHDELLNVRLFKLKSVHFQCYEETFDDFKKNALMKVIVSCPAYQYDELLNATLPEIYGDMGKYQEEIIRIYEEGNDNEDLFVTLLEEFVPNEFLLEVVERIVFERYYCCHFLLLNRVAKLIPKLEGLAEMAEILNNFHLNNSMKDLELRMREGKMEGVIEQIVQNHMIRRQRTNLVALGDELYDLDDPAELLGYLKAAFRGYAREVEVSLFEKYMDYNRFKALKQVMRSLSLGAGEYDQLMFKVLSKTLQQSKQLEQMDEFVKQVLEVFEWIKKAHPGCEFPFTKKKLNTLKIFKFIRIWNLTQAQLDWRKCLDLQDVPSCNAIVHNLIHTAQPQALLEIPFIKLKHKLVKSFCSQKHILDHVYDKDFCEMMMHLASLYIEKGLVDRAQRMFNTLFQNAPPGDTLANISLKLMQYDQTKLEYFRKGLEMAKSAESVCSLIELMKQNESKKGSVFETLTSSLKHDIQDQFKKKKVKIIDTDLISHPLHSKPEKRRFKAEYRKLYVQLETLIDQRYSNLPPQLLQAPQLPQLLPPGTHQRLQECLQHAPAPVRHPRLRDHPFQADRHPNVQDRPRPPLPPQMPPLSLAPPRTATPPSSSKYPFCFLYPLVTNQLLVSPSFFAVNKFTLKDPLDFISTSKNSLLVKLCQSYILAKKYQAFKVEQHDLEAFFFDKTFRNAYLTDRLAKQPELLIAELYHFKDFNINEIMILNLVQIAKRLNLHQYFIEEDKETRVYKGEGKSEWESDLRSQAKRIQGEYLEKVVEKMTDWRVTWGLYEVFRRELVRERVSYSQYLLMRGLMKQSVLEPREEYGKMVEYLVKRVLLGREVGLEVEVEELVDHNNVFILQKLLVELGVAGSQEDVVALYFKKVSKRILRVEEEEKSFDMKVLRSWVANCKDAGRVDELRAKMHAFVQECDDESAKVVLSLLE